MHPRIQSLRILPLQLILAGLLLLGVGETRAQIPLDSLHGPICGMIDPDTKTQVAISPVFTRVNVVITDAIAQATVTQRFVNPFRLKTEVVYLFPLPDQGAVHGMKYQYHDSLYVAQIMEKAKAQAKYDSIKQSGGQAALLLQERPNIFQQRIATMGPGDTAYVEIKLSLPLKYVDGELELAFPTRIGPRYSPVLAKASGSSTPAGPSGGAAAVSVWNPPEDRAGSEFQFNVLVQSGLDVASIYSPSHPIDVSAWSAARKELIVRQVADSSVTPTLPYASAVMLKPVATYPNRDFVLRLKRAATAQDFSLATARDEKGRDFFMLNLYPDPTLLAGARPNLDVVLLVDISGSQDGWPLDREKEITLNILSRLTPKDNVNVMAFSDQVYYAFNSPNPVAASQANLATAENFVRGLSIQGGTELLAAVKTVLASPANPDKKRIFIFLTDGFITDESSVVAAISQDKSQPTIFTFGAGNSLNRYFLEECAAVGNGFATPLVQGDAVGPLIDAAWARIESPQLENIQVNFGGMETTDILYPVSNKLYAGLPYRIYGQYKAGAAQTVTLTGDKQGKPITITKTVDFSSPSAYNWAVPKLWAREKIGQLSLQQGTTDANKSAIVQLSLDYSVLSAYTAFLAAQPQAVSADNNLGTGMTSEISKQVRSAKLFGLTLHDGLLFLDWPGQEGIVAIRIYDLSGHLLFTYRPGAAQGSDGSGGSLRNTGAQNNAWRWVWDGRDAAGRALGQGRYLLSIETSRGMQSRVFSWNPVR